MSFVYIAVLAAVLFLGNLAEKHPILQVRRDGAWAIKPDTGSAVLLSAILILVSGCRYRVGTDFMAYYRWRVTDFSVVWNAILHLKEPASTTLAYLSRLLYDDGQTFILLSAFITVGLFCRTIYKYHSMYLLSMLLYIFIGTWQTSFNGIRQCLAAAVVFAGHRYILKRDWLRYGIVLFIAFLFHGTAIIMVIPCFIFNREADITQLVLLAIGSIIIRFSYGIIFSLIGSFKGKMMDLEGEAYLTNSVNIFRVLITFIPVAVYVIMCRKTGHTKEQTFYINAIIFNAFSMLAGMGSTYFGRVGIYTGAAVSLGYGYLFQLIDDERSRKITIYLVMAIYLAYWLYSLQAGGIANYRSFFSNLG